jgi:tetratricopeptide (TPR) repeat protein
MEFLNINSMKKILPILLLLITFAAYAHRTEIDILDTEAGKAAALAKIGGETGKFIDRQKGLDILAKAMAEANLVKRNELRELVLAEIAIEYAALDEIEKALTITRGLKDVHLHVTNLGKVANKLVITEPKLAEELLAEAVKKAKTEAKADDTPALLAELSGKYVRLKNLSTAHTLLAEANRIVETLKDIHLDDKLSLYAEIAANMVAANQKEEALKLFDKAYVMSNELTDPFERGAILAMLGGELAEKGQPAKAFEMLQEALRVSDEIKDEKRRNDIVSEIARNFSQAKDCEKAERIAKGINDAYYSSEALIRTAKNYSKQKKTESALDLLHVVNDKARTITVTNKRAMVMAKSASEFADLGKKDEARTLLDEALKAIG